MILIVAPTRDAHAMCVAQDLHRMGKQYRIVDSSRLSTESQLQFRSGRQSVSHWKAVDGDPIDLGAVRTVWHRRRFLPPALAGASPPDQDYFRREWTEMLSGVFASMKAGFVNDPRRQEAATKPWQLRLAEATGMRIPDTLITNDPEAVLQFVEQHRGAVVHKSISPPRHRFLATQRWSESDRTVLESLRLAPAIFQEAITGCRELRVTVFGTRAFAAEFRPKGEIIDGRLDYDSPYRAHRLPSYVADGLVSLMRKLGLVFATIDMKLTEEGEYVFLELNPMGQFLYVEILAGLPLTSAMAEFLAEGGESAVNGDYDGGEPIWRGVDCPLAQTS